MLIGAEKSSPLQHPVIKSFRILEGDHRRLNHYAKIVEGLQRALNVQRLIHNWVRPHWGLQKNQTPAMAMGYLERPVTMLGLLPSRGFQYFIP